MHRLSACSRVGLRPISPPRVACDRRLTAGCGLHHALGLVLTRLKRREDALGELRRAAELDPHRAYAVGLHSAGHMAVLKKSLARHPGDRDTLLALISFSRDAGDFGTALDYAEQLARAAPGDPSLVALIENLRRQIKKPDAR
jgi:Flp pilus assembly protein TadD